MNKKTVSAALLIALCLGALFIFVIQRKESNIIAYAQGNLVYHFDGQSLDGMFDVSIYVYETANVTGDNFYLVNIQFHTQYEVQAATVYMDFEVQNSTVDAWEPQTGGTGGSVGLAPDGPEISVNDPMSVVTLDGGFTEAAHWTIISVAGLTAIQDWAVVGHFWTLATMPMRVELNLTAGGLASGFPTLVPFTTVMHKRFASDLPADIDGNGRVDIKDVHYIASYFGMSLSADELQTFDLNHDGKLDIRDIHMAATEAGHGYIWS